MACVSDFGYLLGEGFDCVSPAVHQCRYVIEARNGGYGMNQVALKWFEDLCTL
jgi:hypothetical protein